MQTFRTGQRWVSDTEAELGLGTITETAGRTLTIIFPASGETRAYASDNAPLTRVAFQPGEKALSQAGWTLFVETVEQQHGLLCYHGINDLGEQISLDEAELEANQVFSRPQERLLRGQLDHPRWFNLRHETLVQMQRLAQSDTYGLTGVRAELLPHQLYIAHEVASRSNPRVLLADEVGLGKTIEAGLITHHQLLNGRADRVLILVPEPLLHQWLVELLRRFNLNFRIFDEERCQAIDAGSDADNPFLTEQLVLSHIGLFLNNPSRHTQALNAGWDLLIVDEAHHLQWHENQPGKEYQVVEQLASHTAGVLLLTATPEQLGQSGHFARLRLLDPDRFHDLEAFRAEEARFAPVARAVESLLHDHADEDDLDEDDLQGFLSQLHDEEILQLFLHYQQQPAGSQQRIEYREKIIHELIDRHGTGRVLFRNTRSRISGFPQRQLDAYPLACPAPYQAISDQDDPRLLLQPETAYRLEASAGEPDWWEFDPRVDWLIQLLDELDGDKLLLICARADTAMELELALRTRHGILAAVFHEHMSIVERDRAAAWFADPEDGSALLICSEIGSEGRNFQFARHLVLFDLPYHPDLLEQRIGRLDRIGQQNTIHIHVPYLQQHATETQYLWFSRGLDAFLRTCPEGHTVFRQLEPALREALSDNDPQLLASLLDSARSLAAQTRQALEQGRDHLLELSSCRQPQADHLADYVRSCEYSRELLAYIDQLANCYGLDLEEHSAQSFILRPTAHMSIEHFPGVSDEGLTFTTHRSTALSHEDRHFFSWEHPVIRAAMDLTVSSTHGRTGMLAAKLDNGVNGLFLECLFVLEAVGPRGLQAGKYLPPTCIRLLINSRGEDLADSISFEDLRDHAVNIEKKTLMGLLDKARPVIPGMLEKAELLAGEKTRPIKQYALENMLDHYTNEIQRLTQLQTLNPLVRDDEIEDMQAIGLALHRMLDAARLRLDAVRMVVLA